MLNRKTSMEKYQEYDEQDYHVEGDSTTSATNKRKMGDNFYWLLPLSPEVESASPYPWRYFQAHYNFHKFYSICGQGSPRIVFDQNGVEKVGKADKKISDCLRCTELMDRFGPLEGQSSKEWREGERFVEWKKYAPARKVGFIAVPVDFLYEVKTSGKRKVTEFRSNAQEVLDAFQEQYAAFLESTTWTEREENKVPPFDFVWDDEVYSTGMQFVDFSMYTWGVGVDCIDKKMRNLIREQGVESWGLEDGTTKMSALININRSQKDGSDAISSTAYALNIVQRKDLPSFSKEFILKSLAPNLPNLDTLIEPMSEEETLRRIRLSTPSEPDCFKHEDVFDRFSEKCHNCPVVRACSTAIYAGDGIQGPVGGAQTETEAPSPDEQEETQPHERTAPIRRQEVATRPMKRGFGEIPEQDEYDDEDTLGAGFSSVVDDDDMPM